MNHIKMNDTLENKRRMKEDNKDDLKCIYDTIRSVYDNTYQDAYCVLECIATHIYYPFKDGKCVCGPVEQLTTMLSNQESVPILEEHVALLQERATHLCKECHEHNNETKRRRMAAYKLQGLIVVVTIAYCHREQGIPTNKLDKWGDLLAITYTDSSFNSMYMELWGDCLTAINRVLTGAVREILHKNSEAIDYIMFGTLRSAVGYNGCDSIGKVEEWLAQCDVTDKPVDTNEINKALKIAHTEGLLLWLTEVPDSQRSLTGFGYDTLCLEIAADLSGCAAAQFCIKTGCPIGMMIDYLQYCTMTSERQTPWGHDNAGMNSGIDVVDPAFSAVDDAMRLVETTDHLRALDWLTKHDFSNIARLLAHIYVVTTMSSKMWEKQGSGIAEVEGVDAELLAMFCVTTGGWAHQCVIELGNWPPSKIVSYAFQKDTKLPVSFLDRGNVMLAVGIGLQLAVYDFSSPNAKEASVGERRRGMLKQAISISDQEKLERRDRQLYWALSSSMWQ